VTFGVVVAVADFEQPASHLHALPAVDETDGTTLLVCMNRWHQPVTVGGRTAMT
jgi:hypothetical protein